MDWISADGSLDRYEARARVATADRPNFPPEDIDPKTLKRRDHIESRNNAGTADSPTHSHQRTAADAQTRTEPEARTVALDPSTAGRELELTQQCRA